MAGQTDHALRGDYSQIKPDYTVDQDYSRYTAAEQDLWKRLYARQSVLVPQYGCDEFCDVLATLNFGSGIPRFDEINTKLIAATGWTLVAWAPASLIGTPLMLSLIHI